MKKSGSPRLEVEALDSMLLLSTVVPGTHHATHKPAEVALTGTVKLVAGSIPADKYDPGYVLAELEFVPGAARLAPADAYKPGYIGPGNLARFGKTLVAVSPGDDGCLVELGNRQGSADLTTSISLPTPGASTTAPYSLSAGEGKLFTSITPSGTITLSSIATKAGRPYFTIKFS